jgi:Flp pilus assembly pilin Flp
MSVALIGVVVAVVPESNGRTRNTRCAHQSVCAGGTEPMSLINRLRALRRNDSGQDILEYALLVSLIALVAVGAVTATGVRVDAIFDQITTALSPAP